jgi:copper resistance protein B
MKTLALVASVAALTALASETGAQDPPPQGDHSQHAPSPGEREVDHAAMGHGTSNRPREPIPALTDEDRKAAFPPLTGHEVHDEGIYTLSQLDHLESWDADEGSAFRWAGQGWIGTDLQRLWWRTEGKHVDDHTEEGDAELLYGRSISAWWDVVAGARHDFAPGNDRTWAAFGVMGVAPYKFEVAATAYVGESGRTAARLELGYEVLLTNRLVLQPLLELDLYGKADESRGIGSGVSTMELSLRMRYEITRRFAPYAGVVHERAFSGTAGLRRAAGADEDDTRFVLGVRAWF